MIRIFALFTCFALAGCPTTGECDIFAPIRASKADTAATRQQVDIHNARGVGACGWRA